jgi:hypothetical protein
LDTRLRLREDRRAASDARRSLLRCWMRRWYAAASRRARARAAFLAAALHFEEE